MSDKQRVEFSAPIRSAELLHLRELYETTVQIYSDTHDEWSRATQQARLWHRYEQSLVSQRNAMQSAMSNLITAIKAIEEIEGLHASTH